MSPQGSPTPDWDTDQLTVILEPASAWQLVNAGPGAGKTAIACQRIAYLIEAGVPAARILLVSFTRTAVAELRDRIVSYSAVGERARGVRISTIDANAWRLRMGVDDQELPKTTAESGYDLNIAKTVELFRAKQPDLLDFMDRIEHVIVDEAQDVVSVRADLILEMLRSLSPECGVTVLCDPAQAIYGFTSDDQDGEKASNTLLSRLSAESPRPFTKRVLNQTHRIKNTELVDLFLNARREVEVTGPSEGHVDRVQAAIRENAGNDLGVTSYESFADFLKRVRDESMLVLFRWRADVLFASSYCSGAGVEHRIRMSETPTVVRPWIGWLLGEFTASLIPQDEFIKLWEKRATICAAPFQGEHAEAAWNLLHRFAAGHRPRTIDLEQLRGVLARSHPPVEFCYPELGLRGPILGTIHASKGREADTVVLFIPAPGSREARTPDSNTALIFEEGRVFYVGATRARKMLVAAGGDSKQVGRLDSKRIFRHLGPQRAQLEIGRDRDVDPTKHLSWPNHAATQVALASAVGAAPPVEAHTLSEEEGYALRLTMQLKGLDGVTRVLDIGELSETFRDDFGNLWGRVDKEKKLKPAPNIRDLYMVAVTTVALTDDQKAATRLPYSRSGFALAPVIKGFPTIQFLYRTRGRSRS